MPFFTAIYSLSSHISLIFSYNSGLFNSPFFTSARAAIGLIALLIIVFNQTYSPIFVTMLHSTPLLHKSLDICFILSDTVPDNSPM